MAEVSGGMFLIQPCFGLPAFVWESQITVLSGAEIMVDATEPLGLCYILWLSSTDKRTE